MTSDLLKKGVNPYSREISSLYQEYGFTNQPKIDFATNPPALATFFIPFTYVKASFSFYAWTAVQCLALFCSLILIFRMSEFSLRSSLFFVSLGSIILTYPVVTHIEHGQSQMVIGFMLLLGLCAYLSNNNTKLGPFLWGIATSLKLFTWPFLVLTYYLLGRRGVLWFTAGFILLNIPSLVVVGPQIFTNYFSTSIPYVLVGLPEFSSNNSLLGAIIYSFNLFGIKFEWTKSTSILYALFSVPTVFGIITWHSRDLARKSQNSSIMGQVSLFSVTLILSLLFSPTAWAHYFTLAFLPLGIYLLQSLRGTERQGMLLNALIGYVLISYTQGRVTTSGPVWEFVSSWIGVVGLCYLGWIVKDVKR